MIVTIDGPTASGKSVVAEALAKELGFYYLPTGWFYRAVAYLLVSNCGYSEEALAKVSDEAITQCIDITRLVYTYDEKKGGALYYDQQDITPFLKDYMIDRYVAIISPLGNVRRLVTQAQRAFAKTHDSVIEGRDIGSVVFPEADCKFFLTASLSVRAQRWQKDQEKRGHTFSLKEAQEKIESRDKKDRDREISPLVVPHNAVIVDNSAMTIRETMDRMIEVIKN